MPSIFSRIIAGDIPGTFVHRDERCGVFLSINPLAHGHALVVPIEEIEHWIDLSEELAAHLFAVAHRVGRAQQRAFSPSKVGLIIAGYEVPHTHIHLVPTTSMQQLNFANAASSVTREDLESAAGAIREALDDEA